MSFSFKCKVQNKLLHFFWKEGNGFFNDALNTFYLQLYGVRHMVKDHSDSERGNLLPPHGLLFPISSKGSFICIIPDRMTHTTAFVTPVVEHWLEREIAQWVHHEGSIRQSITPWANALTMELHLAPCISFGDKIHDMQNKNQYLSWHFSLQDSCL